jgi:hypothetical protein
MQHALAAIATSLLFPTVALAADDQAQPAKTEVSEECSKQVWPNFTAYEQHWQASRKSRDDLSPADC